MLDCWVEVSQIIILMEGQESGVPKFIALMRSLTQFIQEDTAHQQTIYECLNSQQIQRLFDSIHDEDAQLRLTAAKFIAYLLFNNSRVVEVLAIMQGYDYLPEHRKYVIGGLEPYLRVGCSLKRKVGLKQAEVVIALGRVKYQPQSIAWAIDLSTYKVAYYLREDEFTFDPKHNIIGIFLKEDGKMEKSKYKISKR